MDVNRVLVFKSIDARKENPSNKPGNFTVKFFPELILDNNRVLVFKSIDARKENPSNKPGNFTVKIFPELILDNNKQQYLALDHISMTASWHNIRPEYGNNKLKISKDRGSSWETITFPSGIHDQYIDRYIHNKIGKITGKDIYGINILFDLATYRVFITLDENHQIDFVNSGNFADLHGFDKKNINSKCLWFQFSEYK